MGSSRRSSWEPANIRTGQLTAISALWQMAQEQIATSLGNINGAIKYIEEGAQRHPNRLDIVAQSAPQGQTSGEFLLERRRGANAFQQPNQPQPVNNVFGAPSSSTSTFGQPAELGATPSPFGAPAFGRPAQPAAASPFGQPSGLGMTPSPFGQPAQPTGAFGQASQLGAKPSAFGTPAFGQPAQPTSAFGQPAALGATPSPFASPAPAATPFGNAQPATNAFGQPTQPAATNAFGQHTQPAATNAFGQPNQPAASNVFGAPTAPAAAANPFGQTAQPATNVFGAPSTAPAHPFGQPAAPAAAPATNAFGNPSPFGQAAPTGPSTANPFGQPAAAAAPSPFGQQQQQQPAPQPPQPTNVFGQPVHTQQPAANPFGQQPQQAPSGFAKNQPAGVPQAQQPPAPVITGQQPDPSTYTVIGSDKRLQRFNSQPVTYMLLKKPEDIESALLPTISKQKDALDALIKRHAGQHHIDQLRVRNQEELNQLKYNMEVPVVREFDGTIRRIWFPCGPPAENSDTEALPGPDGKSPYDDPKVVEQWSGFVATGRFENGVMPEVPPKRSICNWVF